METAGYSCDVSFWREHSVKILKSQTMGIEYVYNNKCIYMNYNLF